MTTLELDLCGNRCGCLWYSATASDWLLKQQAPPSHYNNIPEGNRGHCSLALTPSDNCISLSLSAAAAAADITAGCYFEPIICQCRTALLFISVLIIQLMFSNNSKPIDLGLAAIILTASGLFPIFALYGALLNCMSSGQ